MNPEAPKAALVLPVKRWGKAYPLSYADPNGEQEKACGHIDNDSSNTNNHNHKSNSDDDVMGNSRRAVPTDNALADPMEVGEEQKSTVAQRGFQEETPTTDLDPTAAHDTAGRGEKKRRASGVAEDRVEGVFLHVRTWTGSSTTEGAVTFVAERLPVAPRNGREEDDTVRVVLDCAGSVNVSTMSGSVDLKRTVRTSGNRVLF